MIVTNSRRLVERYKSYDLGLERRMKVIYNGIDTTQVVERGLPLKRCSPLRILGAGRLTFPKNFSDFIEVASRISGETPAEATILGEGPERRKLTDLATKRGLDLRLPGQVDDIKPYLRAADVFLHTPR